MASSKCLKCGGVSRFRRGNLADDPSSYDGYYCSKCGARLTPEGLLIEELSGDVGTTLIREIGSKGVVVYEHRTGTEPVEPLLEKIIDLEARQVRRSESTTDLSSAPSVLKWNLNAAVLRFRRLVRGRDNELLFLNQRLREAARRALRRAFIDLTNCTKINRLALEFAAPFELMKFELVFDGDLFASGNRNKHVQEKWDIRKAIEPQLKELWDTHPSLSGIAISSHPPSFFPNPSSYYDPERYAHEVQRWLQKPHDIRIEEQSLTAWYLRQPILVGEKQFLPLVRKSLALACKLDITFLRQGKPGDLVLPGGDLDNRIKTLFDALSIPDKQDLRGNPDHEPFLCLLEDDSLIIEQHVKTGRLLRVSSSSPNAVHLLIEVSVHVMQITDSNIGFVGD